MRMPVPVRYAVFFLVVVFFAVGCKDKDLSQKKPAAKAPPPAVSEIPSAPAEEEKFEQQVFIYDPGGRRDPFRSLIEIAKEKPQARKKANPIENYDVDELKLSAIIWDNQKYYALITLPDNKSYTIREGMTLGLYGGKVEEITKDSMVIREHVKDYRGQPVIKDTILKLRKEGEE
jgi:type IV pilus assembly protein PilP